MLFALCFTYTISKLPSLLSKYESYNCSHDPTRIAKSRTTAVTIPRVQKKLWELPTVNGCTEFTVTDRLTGEGLKGEWESHPMHAYLHTRKKARSDLHQEYQSRTQELPTETKAHFCNRCQLSKQSSKRGTPRSLCGN
jgi:hypothetical protein